MDAIVDSYKYIYVNFMINIQETPVSSRQIFKFETDTSNLKSVLYKEKVILKYDKTAIIGKELSKKNLT